MALRSAEGRLSVAAVLSVSPSRLRADLPRFCKGSEPVRPVYAGSGGNWTLAFRREVDMLLTTQAGRSIRLSLDAKADIRADDA